MMPKPTKVIKKGYDPPGNNYIALGSKKESSSASLANSAASSANAAATAANSESSTSANSAMIRSTSSGFLNPTNKQAVAQQQQQSPTVQSSASSNLAAQQQSSTSAANLLTSQYYLDPKTIKDEVTKLVAKEKEKDGDETTNEKLAKITKSLIMNIKATMFNSVNPAILANTVNKQQQKTPAVVASQQQQDQDSVNVHLNYVMSLSYIALKRPQLFISENLVEFLCTQFLFSSKQNAGQFSNGSSGGLIGLGTKAKSIHNQLSSVKGTGITAAAGVTGSGSQVGSTSAPSLATNGSGLAGHDKVLATICSLLLNIYECESTWPDIFIRAYIDDSLGERNWVDSVACKEFVDNVRTAFYTKPIPTVQQQTIQQQQQTNPSSLSTTLSSSDLTAALADALTAPDSNMSGDDQMAPPKPVVNRYASNKDQIKTLVIDLIKSYSKSTTSSTTSSTGVGKSQAPFAPIKRTAAGTPVTTPSSTTVVGGAVVSAASDNKNFIKLLQYVCGIDAEVRAIALSRLDAWLLNPKLEASAQDLLMAICCNLNCSSTSPSPDTAFVQQIIRIKPKLKQHQYYFDCIRELVKQSQQNLEALIQLSVRNELMTQQQLSAQQQAQQAQAAKNPHCLNLLQAAFSTDSKKASKILAQTFQKVLVQRNGDENVRSMRIMLRDLIRNNRAELSVHQFTSELINEQFIRDLFMSTPGVSNGASSSLSSPVDALLPQQPLCDFVGAVQSRERYVHSICDLITVCVLVSITPQIKEAYQRMGRSADVLPDPAKDCLIKYYMLMSQIQADSVSWLQKTVSRSYEINPAELIKCLFKVLFMVDKPEQHYTIEAWPSEQERGTLFRVVSEIPVLSETLHQVLLLTKSLPESMYMLMLCVEENLLKTCALVHCKHIYSMRMNQCDAFVQLLFNICLYKAQSPPSLAVTVLYWRAWQCLLILAAVDPKQFGQSAWEHYPTLRVLMEMIMIEDYSFPPQSSVLDEGSVERFRALDNQAMLLEREEILEFENSFTAQDPNSTAPRSTEANSKLIGQVMKFDPSGVARRPPLETLQSIKKLSAEYKLGQLLCKIRQPDFLLSLIHRQTTKQSLPWLSSLIESSSDCLEIMPIQCVCEFVWNLLNPTEEEITFKKINPDQLLNRIKQILLSSPSTTIASPTSDETSISSIHEQIEGIFEYFLEKLSSEKQSTRSGAVRILSRLFLGSTLPISLLPHHDDLLSQLSSSIIDIDELLEAFKNYTGSAYETRVRPLLVRHLRKAVSVETNLDYLNVYVRFLLEQLVPSDTDNSDDSDVDMVNGDNDPRRKHDELAQDLADFFFRRDYFYSNSFANLLMTSSSSPDHFRRLFIDYVLFMFKLNEITDSKKHSALIKSNKMRDAEFDRTTNAFLLIKLANNSSEDKMLYINEKQFNLLLYFVINVIDKLSGISEADSNGSNGVDKDGFVKVFDLISTFEYVNCDLDMALNDLVKRKIFTIYPKIIDKDTSEAKLVTHLIKSTLESKNYSTKLLLTTMVDHYGLSPLTSSLIIDKLSVTSQNEFDSELSQLLQSRTNLSVKSLIDLFKSSATSSSSSQIVERLVRFKGGETNGKKASSSQQPVRIFSVSASSHRPQKRQRKPSRESPTKKSNNIKSVEEQIKLLSAKYNKETDSKMEVDELQHQGGEKRELVDIISQSSSQNLEANILKRLDELQSSDNNESRVTGLLAESIFSYEEGKIDSNQIKQEPKTTEEPTTSYKRRCTLDFLLDLYCRRDPHIVRSKSISSEFRLLFERRQTTSSIYDAQSFLLALFIHQADWSNLFECIRYLLESRSAVFSDFNQKHRLNPTIVLDFFSSLIHIPELWKGTETRILQKYNEENVLNLNGKQLCALLDYIIEEMFILNDRETANNTNKEEVTKTLLNNSFKRVQLLIHFLKKKDLVSDEKQNPYDLIIDHLKRQIEEINKLNNSSEKNKTEAEKTTSTNVLVSLQAMVVFAIYLEDHSIIESVPNPNRMFFQFYNQVNQPTKLDLKAHNLLNCFGEVEVNYSQNASSSGIIGVAAGAGTGGVGFRKQQEKQEMAAYVKKQEAFMMDANLVLVKLASRHPYMFIRQLAMMEGLLQGRVAYSFDEFRRRKFDKLFHYVIDILNNLVPYIFHPNFFDYVVAIISHYFDVFMSYSSESREFIGSLGKKFIEFLDRFLQCDLKCAHLTISRKYSQFLDFFQKSYPEIHALRNLTSIEAIPFDHSQQEVKDVNDNEIDEKKLVVPRPPSNHDVNILNQKIEQSQWSSSQLEVFINRLADRDNYEGIACVLQELDAISQRDTTILSHFVYHLRPLIMDQNDIIRELSISLLMRYLRLNPKESVLFYEVFCEALSNSNSKVFNSVLRVLAEFVLLCPEKANSLIKITTKNSFRHNVDPSKMLTDSIKMLTLEKYVY